MEREYYVNPSDIAERLALWWRYNVSVNVSVAIHNFIDCKDRIRSQPNPKMITWVYADAVP